MTAYEQVTYRDGAAVRVVILQAPAEAVTAGERFLAGDQVDQAGMLAERDDRPGAVRLVIAIALIMNRTPMTMNQVHGRLEPAATAGPDEI